MTTDTDIHKSVLYWLSIVPLDELDTCESKIAERYRSNQMTLSIAVQCLYKHKNNIKKWIDKNKEIEDMLYNEI